MHLGLVRPVENKYTLGLEKVLLFAFMVRLVLTCVCLCSQLFELLLGSSEKNNPKIIIWVGYCTVLVELHFSLGWKNNIHDCGLGTIFPKVIDKGETASEQLCD